MINDPGEPSETHLCADFAIAGQDAFALVACMAT